MRAELLRYAGARASQLLLAAGASPEAALVVKVTLIAALGFMVARLASRASAAARHLIVAATLAVVLLLPLASFLIPSLPILIPTAPAAMGASFHSIPAAAGAMPVIAEPESAAPAAPPSAFVAWLRPMNAAEITVLIWALGAGLALLPLLLGLGEVRRLQAEATVWREGQIRLRGLMAESGPVRRIRVLLHGAGVGPMTCGLLGPTIVLPDEARRWPGLDLDRALIHELEHIRRRDWLTHCAAHGICALYWFHPLVWTLQRRLKVEAERACDDAVLRRADALEYAHQLLGFAEQRAARRRSPLLALAGRADLTTRIRAMLDGAQRRGQARRGAAVAAAAAALTIVVAVAPLRLTAARAQGLNAPIAPEAHFTVASIRPWGAHERLPRSFIAGVQVLPGRVLDQCAGLTPLVDFAYGLTGSRPVVGLPNWSRPTCSEYGATNAYLLQATMPPSTTHGQVRQMMQSLLVRRFGFVAHWETREMPVLALIVAKSGLKIKPADPANDKPVPPHSVGCPVGSTGCQIVCCGSMSMADLAGMLSGIEGRPVIDATHAPGKYLFGPYGAMRWRGANEADSSLPALPTLLHDHFGIELKPERSPVRVLVVTRAQRPSTDSAPEANAGAQPPAPVFDAVSIKPAAPNLQVFGKIVDPERLVYPNATLYGMTIDAYGLGSWQITGGPAWFRNETFALNAETARPTGKAEMMLMLRMVLADRFGLRMRQTTRTGDVYKLEVAPGGAKMSEKPLPASAYSLFPNIPVIHLIDGSIPPLISANYYRYVTSGNGPRSATVDTAILGRQATIGDITQGLSNILNAPVTDATGLKGKYYFALRYSRETGNSVADVPSLPEALRRQLGLELVKSQGSYEVYTVVAAHEPGGN